MGFPGSSVGKESAYNAGDPSSIPRSGRSAGEGIGYPLQDSWASLVAQLVKNLPAIWETWLQSLGWEDPLEKGKAIKNLQFPVSPSTNPSHTVKIIFFYWRIITILLYLTVCWTQCSQGMSREAGRRCKGHRNCRHASLAHGWCSSSSTQRNSAAAAAAKLLQLCPTLCNPIDSSPPGSAVPGILQARTLEWVAISFSIAWTWKVKVKSLSRDRLVATPRTVAHQAPPSMGFSRQEYWSGLPLPSLQRNSTLPLRAFQVALT